MSRLKLAPPWIIYYNKLAAFFRNDDTVRVIYDEENYEIKLFCKNSDVADALTYILPAEQEFGNITLKVTVVPANGVKVYTRSTPVDLYDVYRTAFMYNDSVADVVPVTGIMSNPIVYVIFEPEIVQYWTDDLSDAHGLNTTLMQDIARDIFVNQDGIFFCTDRLDATDVNW